VRGAFGTLVALAGGDLLMGSVEEDAYPEEGPLRRVDVAPFRIAATATTVEHFAAFVAATGHVTQAERVGWAFVFAGLLPDDFAPTRGVADAPWWRQVEGASWRRPEGSGSDVADRGDHPVVCVSWADAVAYCRWLGGGARLPTEAEWELAARGGLRQQPYPWGAEREPGGHHRMNVWQGRFPVENLVQDGWYGTCPAGAYEPNGYGLYNATGNVWEWTADPFVAGDPHSRALRGGSYLCHHSYCLRYRTSARTANRPDAALGNLGFRVAANAS
jgi:sulfatase modifying factor 1